MHYNDFVMNIRETYKDCDDRLEKNYKQEFETYSPTKLDKIWDVIQENHNFAKAPELGNIFKYMNLVGVARIRPQGTHYNRCTEVRKDADGIDYVCSTKYSMRAKLCPSCNKLRNIDNLLVNSIEIVKCEKMPDDLIELQEVCAICPIYKRSKTAKGIRCDAWGTHDYYKKIGKDCKNCKCYACCNAKPSKAADIPEAKEV